MFIIIYCIIGLLFLFVINRYVIYILGLGYQWRVTTTSILLIQDNKTIGKIDYCPGQIKPWSVLAKDFSTHQEAQKYLLKIVKPWRIL